MASPLQEAGFAHVNVDPSNDGRSHESDTEPTGSQAGVNTRLYPTTCQWRSAQFHDQECLRYFDCPSHLVERRLSDNYTRDGPDTDEPVFRSGDRPQARNISHETFEAESFPFPELSRGENDEPDILQDGVTGTVNVESSPIRPQDRELPPTPYSPNTDLNTGIWRSPAVSNPTRRDSQPGILRQSSNEVDEGPARGQYRSDGESRRTSRRSVIITEPTEDLNALRRTRTRSSADNGGGPAAGFVGQQPSIEAATDPHDSGDEERSADFALARWQPDAEVTYCPICHNQFSIFVRKHHCRKCGRVVCASCSPHRIIIPHQYIVRAPGYELPASQNLLLDGLVATYGLSGGERVRLCNPCVPDPNIAPPHSPSSARSSHSRSRNGMMRVRGGHGRYSMMHSPSEGPYSDRYYSPRTRSITMLPSVPGSGSGSSSRSIRHASDRFRSGSLASAASSSYPARVGSLSGLSSSSRRRPLPARPLIAEEDECPVCHRELPSRSLPEFEALRENHITSCILEHSQYGNSPRRTSTSDRGDGGGEASSAAAPRRTGMYTYLATEKDCIDDAECTICLEEFTVGIPMARLECLCRFHRSCIAAWFVNHPGRCPVHQHDGFGY